MAKRSFITGALWLTITSVSLRGVGMIYRVYISTHLSESGMGLYQLILSVYMLCVAFAGAGVSVAVTRLVSLALMQSGRAGAQKILRTSLIWSTALGVAVGLVMAVGAPDIAVRFIHDPDAAASLRLLAPGLPFMSAAGCFNGYFLAVGRVHYSCIAQVAEQAARISVTVVMLSRFTFESAGAGCAAVFLGNTVSEIVASVMLGLFYAKDIRTVAVGTGEEKNVFSRLLTIQLPIAAGRYITSLLHTCENLLVPLQLSKFGDRESAMRDFGALKGMALPLIMFPSSLLSSLAGLLVPEFNFAHSDSDSRKLKLLTHHTLLVTFIFSLFMGGVFYRFGGDAGRLIYGSENVSTLLTRLAPLLPFMYLDCVTDGLLKGTGEQFASLRYCTGDSLMRILLVWILLPVKGLSGFLIVMAVSNISISLLGLRRLLKVTHCTPPIKKGVVLPLIGAALAHILSSPFSLIPGGVVYVIVFFAFLYISGALRPKDLQMIFKPKA